MDAVSVMTSPFMRTPGSDSRGGSRGTHDLADIGDVPQIHRRPAAGRRGTWQCSPALLLRIFPSADHATSNSMLPSA